MSDGRCRACGAAVAPNAAWCSLCFADLRLPTPEPVREPAAVAAVPTQPAVATQPVAAEPVAAQPPPADLALAEPTVEIDPADPLGLTGQAPPTWPCPRCGQSVAIELDACDACGAGFLSGAAATESVRLPVVGDVRSMSSSQRLLLAFGIAVAVTVVLVLLAFVGGHLFG
jgi:uncharacterized OB-fold protein